MPTPSVRAALTLALAALVSAAGCAVTGPDSPPTLAETPAVTAEISPAVMGGDNGLEMAWWVVPGQGLDLGGILAHYADRPVPLDPLERATWEANGLRVVSVPLADLGTLRATLKPIGAINRQWLGQSPLWTDLVKGPSSPSAFTLVYQLSRLTLPAGRVRLLGRFWTQPEPGSGRSLLRVELLPQGVPMARRAEGDPAAAAAIVAPEREGLLLRDLAATMILEPGSAILLVPESPEAVWEVGEATPDPRADAPAQLVVAEDAEDGQGVWLVDPGSPEARAWLATAAGALDRFVGPLGPPAPRSRTVGEAMLTGQPEGQAPAPRAIIVLIPRLPERFDLLGR